MFEKRKKDNKTNRQRVNLRPSSPADFVFLLFARHNVNEFTSALTHSSVKEDRGGANSHDRGMIL